MSYANTWSIIILQTISIFCLSDVNTGASQATFGRFYSWHVCEETCCKHTDTCSAFPHIQLQRFSEEQIFITGFEQIANK